MAIGGRDDQTIHEYLLNADQYLGELKEVAKAIRQGQRQEKDLELVRKELGVQTDKLSDSTNRLTDFTKSLSSGLMAKVTAANLASMAIQKLGGSLKEAYSDIDKYSQASNIYTGNIEAARAATDGLASDLDLMTAKNKLMTLGVKLSEVEFISMLKSTSKLSMAMGIDLKQGVESVTTALARKSVPVADNIGLVIQLNAAYKQWAEANGVLVKDMTEANKAIAFRSSMLGQASDKANDLSERVVTLTDDIKRLTIATWNDITAAGAWVNVQVPSYWERYKEWASGLDQSILGFIYGRQETGTQLAKVFEDAGDQTSAFIEKTARATKELQAFNEQLYGGASAKGGGGLGGVAESSASFMTGLSSYEVKAGGGKKAQKGARITDYLKAYKKKKGAKGRQTPHQVDTHEDVFVEADIRDIVDIGPVTDFTEALSEQVGAWNALSDARRELSIGEEWASWKRGTDAMYQHQDATRAVADAYDAMASVQKSWAEDTKGMALGAIQNLTTGMVMSLDALIMGTDSFGMSMLKLVKHTAFGVMGEAAAHAIKMAGFAMEFSTFAAMPIVGAPWIPTAAAAWASTAKWAAIAAGAGLVGLGTSAAISASGGGGGGASGGSAGQGAFGGGANSSYRPTFGQKKESTQPITIYVQIGDHDNPSATVLATKQIETRLKMAA